MHPILARLVGLLLVGGGMAAAVAGLRHGGIALHDEVYCKYHATACILFAPAAVLFMMTGLRLLIDPAAGTRYPFLLRGRFWRWAGLGILAIFFGLGLTYATIDPARFICRGACALWLAMLVFPLLLSARVLTWAHAVCESRPGRIVDLVVGNVVLLTLLFELGLRGLAMWTGDDALLVQRSTACRLVPGVYSNGLRANSLGFADTEFAQARTPGMTRVAALGDSFSAGTAVAYEDNYLTRLEGGLAGSEVYNFGVCGTGPREYYHMLQQVVWPYQPDLVLVPVFIGNDVTEWIATPQLCRFNPDALYTELLATRLFRLAREQWRQSGSVNSTGYEMGVLIPFSEQTYLELTAGRLVVCRKAERPSDRARWQHALDYLDRIVVTCREHHVPVAFVILPDHFQIDQELRGRALVVAGSREDDLDLDLPQRRLREFCTAREVPCLDLMETMARIGPAAYIPNDGHWSVLGNHAAAATIAPWLVETFPNVLGSPVATTAPEQPHPH